MATIGSETYVIVARGVNFYLERFSSGALNDAGEYDFSFTASGLPVRASGHNASLLKIRKIAARVLDTKTLFINGLRVQFPNCIFDDGANGYSGDISVNMLGCQKNSVDAPWTISSDEQLPVTVLSVSMYGYYNV